MAVLPADYTALASSDTPQMDAKSLITCLMDRTDEAQLGKLKDHPVLRRQLQGKVLHSGKVVGLGYYVILQLEEQRHRKNKT